MEKKERKAENDKTDKKKWVPFFSVMNSKRKRFLLFFFFFSLFLWYFRKAYIYIYFK